MSDVLKLQKADLELVGDETIFANFYLRHVIDCDAPGAAGLDCVIEHLFLRHSSLRIQLPQLRPAHWDHRLRHSIPEVLNGTVVIQERFPGLELSVPRNFR